ncbi:MAG: twin-arginine translocation signal domain-containing protein [Proteobacteria bacterium]|nr:twin-arginine translocation signal domain-containing protein [Pseudomonadota bacterium]
MKHLNRRDFLKVGAAGTATLTIPSWLAGCASTGAVAASTTAAPVPPNPFLTWFGIDEPTLSRLMTELSSRGADLADLYFQYRRSNSISMEDGIISRADSSVDEGVGLRVVVGDQTGYAFTEDLSVESMLAAARTAASIAHGGGAEAPVAFDFQETPKFYDLTVPWADVGIASKLPVLEQVEGYAKALDPAVTKVQIWWNDTEERVLVADLKGHVHTDLRPATRLWVSVTATKDGETLSGGANIAGRHGFDWYTEEQLRLVAKQAVDRTMVLFDARRPPAGTMPVILAAGASGILLHEAIGHGLEADFNRKGVSIYADLMGQQIAPDFVTIVDSGVIEGERGALNFDDEGRECERTVLVEEGKLASYLHDGISARHYGVDATGSGRRQSFRHVPLPRMRCTYMEDGPHTPEEIIASVDNGIIAETFTNGQVQIGAGDFTFYVKNGWLVEGGKVTAPIKDCNIIGNGPAALKAVTMAANDAKLDTGGWTCGKDGQGVPVSQGLPTVLVSELVVGGDDV